MFQESTTDADIASAALRQQSILGVSAADLRKMQDLQVVARTAQKAVESLARDSEPDPKEQALRSQQVIKAFQEFEAHLSRLQQQAPSLAQALATTPPSLRAIQARLGAGQVLAIFAPQETATSALVISKTGAQHRILPITSARQTEPTTALRSSVMFPNDASAPIPAFDTNAAATLYADLFGWAQSSIANAKEITVIASGPLASIPFSVLLKSRTAGRDYRDMPWLIKSVAVTHAPSVAAWLSISSPNSSGLAKGFVAWADPDFGNVITSAGSTTRSVRKTLRSSKAANSGALLTADIVSAALVPLPETKGEAEAIARALGANAQRDVIAGRSANRSSVLEASQSGQLMSKAVVMFATHGLAPGQLPGLNQPALALARERDGLPLLVLDDVMSLRTNADWVILSACNTSSAGEVDGDALSGLARGFFFAGAKSLLVTHWEVELLSAANITVRTMEKYTSNRSLTRSQALQQTAIEMIEGKESNPEWAHPIYWAPYALVGDGRR